MLPCAHDRLRLPARDPTSSQGRTYFVDHRSQVTSWVDPRLPQQPREQQQQQKPDVRGEFNHRSAGPSMTATATSATAAAAAAAAAATSSSSKSFKPTGTWVSSADFEDARPCRRSVAYGSAMTLSLVVYTYTGCAARRTSHIRPGTKHQQLFCKFNCWKVWKTFLFVPFLTFRFHCPVSCEEYKPSGVAVRAEVQAYLSGIFSRFFS